MQKKFSILTTKTSIMVRAWIYAYNLFLLGCKMWTLQILINNFFFLSHTKNIFMDEVGDFVFHSEFFFINNLVKYSKQIQINMSILFMSNFNMLQPFDNKLVMLQNSFQLYSSMLRKKCKKPMNVIDMIT
jgi:hypothetical protein